MFYGDDSTLDNYCKLKRYNIKTLKIQYRIPKIVKMYINNIQIQMNEYTI